MDPKLWLLWNLFLAVIPVALGVASASVGRAILRRGRTSLWLLLVPLLLLWLAFLPNSCYLFTELRHFLDAVDRQNLWFRAKGDPMAMVQVLQRAAVGFLYVVAGALTFGLAIRPLRKLAAEAGLSMWWSPLFFILVALGVYLGLSARYNSWNLFIQPHEVLRTAFAVSRRPPVAAAILFFGIFLWVAYEIIDIWIDGFVFRWSHRFQARALQEEPLPAGRR